MTSPENIDFSNVALEHGKVQQVAIRNGNDIDDYKRNIS